MSELFLLLLLLIIILIILSSSLLSCCYSPKTTAHNVLSTSEQAFLLSTLNLLINHLCVSQVFVTALRALDKLFRIQPLFKLWKQQAQVFSGWSVSAESKSLASPWFVRRLLNYIVYKKPKCRFWSQLLKVIRHLTCKIWICKDLFWKEVYGQAKWKEWNISSRL